MNSNGFQSFKQSPFLTYLNSLNLYFFVFQLHRKTAGAAIPNVLYYYWPDRIRVLFNGQNMMSLPLFGNYRKDIHWVSSSAVSIVHHDLTALDTEEASDIQYGQNVRWSDYMNLHIGQ